jgi:FdhD protein
MRYRDGEKQRIRDTLVVEEPLEIRLSWSRGDATRAAEPLAVTMRTPGDEFELVAGFLHGEGVVTVAEDILELTYCRGDRAQEYNTVEARLRPGVAFDLERTRRNFYATSSCGVCGKASLDAVTSLGCRAIPAGFEVDRALLPALPDLLRDRQDAFDRTGGLHAAGLFGVDGACLGVREDVGRHNAVDKVLGAALLERRLPASEAVLVVSGRASFELVQKAVMAGVPMLVAVGAPSTLAVDLAREFGQTLVGFARDAGCNVYTGDARVV